MTEILLDENDENGMVSRNVLFIGQSIRDQDNLPRMSHPKTQGPEGEDGVKEIRGGSPRRSTELAGGVCVHRDVQKRTGLCASQSWISYSTPCSSLTDLFC